MTNLGIRLWIEIEAVRDKQGGWTAFCNALQFRGIGPTEDAAVRALLAVVQTSSRAMNRRSVLEQTLLERGIQYTEIIDYDVPLRKTPIDILNDPPDGVTCHV